MHYFSNYNWFTQQCELQSSYYSAMQWATGLELHYVIANSEIGE